MRTQAEENAWIYETETEELVKLENVAVYP
jgi:hypothetical protein